MPFLGDWTSDLGSGSDTTYSSGDNLWVYSDGVWDSEEEREILEDAEYIVWKSYRNILGVVCDR